MLLYPARRLWAMAIGLIGLVLVGLALLQRSLFDGSVPIAVGAWSAWGIWAVAIFVPEPWVRLRTALSLAMIAGASLAGASTDVVGYVPAVSGLITVAGAPEIPRRVAIVAAVESAALVTVGAVLDPDARGVLTSIGALLVICTLGGMSRRQYRISEAQTRDLLEQRLVVEQVRATVALLTERSRIARDLHDVLAHSLGGLALQLAAVDALLEKGKTDEARTRVQAAHKLAVDGLEEAKEAVNTLRGPHEPLSAVVRELAEMHRATGGQIAVRGDADRGELDANGRIAVRRAVQEILTNARQHAHGAPTTLDLDWDAGTLTIAASTPPGKSAAHVPGGGHGLTGMRERVEEAGGTMTVRHGPPFEVIIELPGMEP